MCVTVVGVLAGSWWWLATPSAEAWGAAAEALGALAGILAFSFVFYTTRHEVANRKQADDRADRADARAADVARSADEDRRREYARQVSWWTQACVHEY